jgi:Resolvase, N terminal domain
LLFIGSAKVRQAGRCGGTWSGSRRRVVGTSTKKNASGGHWDRPQLHKLLDHLGKGDVLLVWKLDRLSRSLSDLLHILKKLDDAGAGFKSLTEAIDTTTPAGRMMMQMLGSFAASRSIQWPGTGMSSIPTLLAREKGGILPSSCTID